jgi:pyrimidine deaminase RibD-like protein
MRTIAAELAEEMAGKSGQYQRHGAVVVQNGKIVSSGFNKSTGKYPGMHTLHAEMAAIKMCSSVVDSHIYVVRINNQGLLANSKPCKTCYKYMVKHKVARVWWSTGIGDAFDSMDVTRSHECRYQPGIEGCRLLSSPDSEP